jgi:hypothetical protein
MKTKLKNDPTAKLEETYNGKWKNVYLFDGYPIEYGDRIYNSAEDAAAKANERADAINAKLKMINYDRWGGWVRYGNGRKMPWKWLKAIIQMPTGDA